MLGYLLPVILRKHRLTNFRNLFFILVVTFHVLLPYRSTDLTLLLMYKDHSLQRIRSTPKILTHNPRLH